MRDSEIPLLVRVNDKLYWIGRIARALLPAAGLALCLAGVVAVFALARLEIQLTRDMHQTAIQAQLTMTEIGTTARTARATALRLGAKADATLTEGTKTLHAYRGLADTIRKATLDERDAIQEFNDEGVKAAKNLNAQINSANLAGISDAFLRTATQAQTTLKSSADAMDAAAGIMRDPRLQEAFSSLASSADELNGTISDVHQVTTHYRKEILAPASKAKALFNFGKDFAADALTHLLP